MPYRLRVEITYTTSNAANTALTNINNTLTASFPSIPQRATRETGSNSVLLLVTGIADQASGVALRDALTPQWGSGNRSAGKASLVKTDDLT